jgi:hypothetical protein
MECHNPECDNDVPENPSRDVKYCCVKCRNRANRIIDTARNRAGKSMVSIRAPISIQSPGSGIGPLNTRQIRASRAREQALIDKVVAKALEGDSNTMTDRKPRLALRGVKVG